MRPKAEVVAAVVAEAEALAVEPQRVELVGAQPPAVLVVLVVSVELKLSVMYMTS